MSVWFGGRLFRPVKTSGSSQTTSDTIFKYEQRGDLVTATYSGGNIELGHIIGLVDDAGLLDMRYHHIDVEGRIWTGICLTEPEVIAGGKLRLHEQWKWTCGDESEGTSTLEEI